MAERRRGRGRGRKSGLVADQAANEVVATNEEADEEWNKVVEKKQVAYNPDKVRSKQVEIAKVRVMVNEAKEELETAVVASDFIKAQEMKEKIAGLGNEQARLEKELKLIREGVQSPGDPVQENSNPRSSVVPLITKFPALFENVEEPEETFSNDDTDDEFAPPGAPKKKKRKSTVVKKVKRLKKSKSKAPSFLPESIVGKYSVLIHREDPEYEATTTEKTADNLDNQADDLTKIDDCDENPNFALVLDFLARFGDMVGLRDVATKDFQLMLCAQVSCRLVIELN